MKINFFEHSLHAHQGYRTEIDGLRAIAILSVLLFHAGFSFFRGGFIGVDIFFVLSGFLMTSIILKEKEEGKFTLKKFYERRIRRIIPMLLFTLLLFYYFAYQYLEPKELIFYTKSSVRALFAISNIFFAKNTGGYFDTTTDLIPLIHTWTLGVEEQFYIILPLLFIVVWNIGRNKLFVLLSYLVIISFFLNFVFINKIHNFYLLHTRFWELGIGSLIAFIREVKVKDFRVKFGFNSNSKVINISSKLIYNLISIFSLITILLSVYYLHEKVIGLQFKMLFPTIATALLIIFTTKDTLTYKILSFKPLRLIGLISYSAYLLHQPIFAFVRISNLETITKQEWALWIVLIFVLAYFTWKFIENPFRKKEKIKYKYIIIAFISFIAFFHLANSITKMQQGFPRRFEMSEKNLSSLNANLRESLYTVIQNNNIAVIEGEIKNNVATPKSKISISKIGLKSGTPNYFLTGNSMSSILTYLFNEIQVAGEYTAMGHGCKFLLTKNEKYRQTHKIPSGFSCHKVQDAVYEHIKANGIKRLFIAGLWHYFLNIDLKEDLQYTIQKYAELGVHIYIIQEPPFQKNVPHVYYMLTKMKKLNNENLRKLSRKTNEYLKEQEAVEVIFDEYKNNPNVTFIKIHDLICDEEVCPIGTTQEAYYTDSIHLSLIGVKRLQNRLKQYIENNNP